MSRPVEIRLQLRTSKEVEAFEYAIDLLRARFGSGDVGMEDNEIESHLLCAAGDSVVASMGHALRRAQ